jgi:hypothetical protein
VGEPQEKSEQYATLAIICGLAPFALFILAFVPFLGCLSTPLTLVSVLCAVGFGIAGVVNTPAGKRLSPRAIGGLVLGVLWLLVIAVGVVALIRSGWFHDMQKLMFRGGH